MGGPGKQHKSRRSASQVARWTLAKLRLVFEGLRKHWNTVTIATVVFTVFAGSQWYVMRGQLREAQAEQRPWISFTNDSGIESLYIYNGQLNGTFKVTLQNTGRNPAVFVFAAAEMSIAASVPHGSMQAWEHAVCHEAPSPTGFTMFPNSFEPAYQITVRTQLRDVSVVWPLVAGCITYQDAVTGLTHYTPFAFQISMRALRPAIALKDLPLRSDSLIAGPWIIDNLPPT